VVPVSTLAALAQGAWRRLRAERVLAAIDARMSEVYWGAYALGDGEVMMAAQEEEIARPEAVAWPDGGGWHGVGTGWETYGEVLAEAAGARLVANHGRALPDARDMLPLAHAAWARGEAVTAAEAVPVYLRDRVAERPRQR
jgi:tRNA threonylcarbamoyladenosine biosynthesis protein TsaB